ncbi:C4-dicarboxylate ABC transporter [Oleisolibacter albus]|uniref:SLAC1 family transporter n=1 Tax=Oleisolibacter albus TaxID=2171757 RepID=UPI000DF31DDF|nr:C4-dicarboxylate ABC transporter [Oleisolibacter albus]
MTLSVSSQPPHARLEHLPLPLFAAPMGVGGLGLAWREAARGLGAPAAIGEMLLLLAGLLWLLIAALHVVRFLAHPAALADDLKHPVRSAFAGAITIGLLILAGGLIPHAPAVAALLWLAAAAAHVTIAAWTVRSLLQAPREMAALTPPLLIPLVGNVLAPIFGAKLGFETLSWMMFGLGALLWVILQPLLLGRLITGPALPPRLRPSLVILLAPPSVAALSLASLTGGYGPAPLVALGLALFLALVLATMIAEFTRAPFAMSWWGWTFPTAAFVTLVQAAAQAKGASSLLAPLLWLLLAGATSILVLVAAATLRAAWTGHLLQPEG